MKLTLVIFIFSLGLLASLPWLYFLQIKDYFYLRVFSGLREQSLRPLVSPFPFKAPAKSLRNLLVLLLSYLILGLLAYWISLHIELKLLDILLLVGAGYIFARLAVVISVTLTEPIAYFRREFFVRKARKMVLNSSAVFIGVTGSYGKSSVKEFLAALLSASFPTAKSIENYNSDTGVAISVINNLRPDTRYFVSEMGAYTTGTIAKSASIINPRIGVLTGLGNQHLDTFGSRENIIKAKSELLSALPEDGRAYINIDCEGSEKALLNCKCQIIKYSISNSAAEILATIGSIGSQGTTFGIKYGQMEAEFKTRLLGEHNVLNLLPTIAIASDLGVPLELIQDAVSTIEPLKGRLFLTVSDVGVHLMNDSYNNSLMGFMSAVSVMKLYPAKRKILVTKGIIELGEEKEASYQKIRSELDSTDVSVFTTDSDLAAPDSRIKYISTEDELISLLGKTLEPGDLLLVKGRFSPNFMKRIGL